MEGGWRERGGGGGGNSWELDAIIVVDENEIEMESRAEFSLSSADKRSEQLDRTERFPLDRFWRAMAKTRNENKSNYVNNSM